MIGTKPPLGILRIKLTYQIHSNSSWEIIESHMV